MAIAYNAGTNIITVTGYTEGTPCNFTDIYNADKAGTLSLHARTGITGTDGAGVAVDRAERPADYIVLGGASNDLYITVANWNGTTSTIRITGTDRDGSAQTEDIVVNANGQYNTTKWFKTITHTQVTVFTATSFDYDLTQGQWGVVWRQSTNQFLLQCLLCVGNGSTATWMETIEEQITFETNGCGASAYLFYVQDNAIFTSGVLIDEPKRQGKHGSSIIVRITDIGDTDTRFVCGTSGIVYLYATHIACINTAGVGYWQCLFMYNFNSNCRVYQTIFTDCRSLAYFTGTDVQNLLWVGNNYSLEDSYFSTDSAYIWAFGGNWDIASPPKENLGQPPLTNFYAESVRTWSSAADYIGGLRNFLGSLPLPTMVWQGTPVAGCYLKWYADMDLKVTDKYGNDIVGATVTVKNTNGDQQFSTNTDANGEISETVFVVKDAWSGTGSGNTRTDYNDFTMTIVKDGYMTYEKKFTVYKAIDWEPVMLTPMRRNPPMTGGMV
jgi:hypothetical protein